jgi:micrococcal nuclease
VARYPGDDWYWGAYTSVIKVTVRQPKPSTAPTIWVGITETGECYHRLTCQYYTQHPAGNQRVSLQYAKSQGYRPCSVCDPPQ